MPRNGAFRLANKNIFLTYHQCSLSKEEALSQLKSLFTTRPPSYIRVSSEPHEDGQPHLHCLLQFPYRFETQDQRFFDLVSRTRSTHFHPIIEGAGNSSTVQQYISKDGNFIDDGQFNTSKRSSIHDTYRRALASGTKEEALSIIGQGDPMTLWRHFKKINRNLDHIFQKPPEEYHSPFATFNAVPPQLVQWATTNIRPTDSRLDAPMSLILEGPTRTGKTCWARSLGSHNYYAGDMDLRHHNDNALYNVIDNVSPKYLEGKHWKQFIGSKRDWVSDIRYGKPKEVKGGIPSIVICNPGPGTSYKDYLDKQKKSGLKEWTVGNAEFFFLQDPIY